MTDQKQQIKEVKAYARYVHMSPQKLRLVADLVRQTPVEDALEQLKFSQKNASKPISKLINSAIANAVHNFDLKKEDLFVKSITVDGGPVYKRYAPRAQGRAFIERKRTSHLSVVLQPRTRGKKPARSIFSIRPKIVEQTPSKTEAVAEGKIEEPKVKPAVPTKASQKVKQQIVNLKRRLFNRRSGS